MRVFQALRQTEIPKSELKRVQRSLQSSLHFNWRTTVIFTDRKEVYLEWAEPNPDSLFTVWVTRIVVQLREYGWQTGDCLFRIAAGYDHRHNILYIYRSKT